MTITDAILMYLGTHSEGATTEELWKHAKQMGCEYRVKEEKKQKKSTSGICSKLCKKGTLCQDKGRPKNKWYKNHL